MRTATRYAHPARKGSGAVPVHSLILVAGLILAVGVMFWSMHQVQSAYNQPRRLGEAGSVIVGGTGAEGKGQEEGTASAGSPVSGDLCHEDPHNEYHGDVVTWGEKNIKANSAECCESCSKTPGCNIWVFCGEEEGCGYTSPRGLKGSCWLKHNTLSYILENAGQGHSGITWTAGAVYSAAEYDAYVAEHAAAVQAEVDRLRTLRDDPELPLVWMEVAVNGTVLGRIEMVLFVKESPRAAENLRLLCSGELGTAESGQRYHIKGSYFYRIIDRFIDQTGAAVDGIFGGEFHDDPGGLRLQHTHKHAEEINRLAKGHINNELLHSQAAQIVDAGQTRPGSHVTTPEFRAVIESEKRRIAWRNSHRMELGRLRQLFNDKSLPLVYLDVAIKGVYAGRMEFVLFPKQSPRAAENFRLLCTGEAGMAPPGHEGAGQPYHFKGVHFYRIIENFIDQTGQVTDSPLGGLFLDDPDGLRLNHTHPGLLSMANIGPNTNGAHFSIIMGAPHHLDGHYTIFGEIVDGHHVAYEINALAHGEPNGEHSGSKDAQIIDSGQLRRGSYMETPEFKAVIESERKRIQDARPK
ncbi:Peptidyl-prolyl cis-trans isomerase cyp5 [Tetrabaena socialis]|uniref:Peptidyl-prolyl cis-trans isomerase cyp5 n=1 Tax=Tetrabaena socialis TaxID=47790 RepID=A0A2J7ZQC3_9CHLO|nr:Peptidyl-prolyl cis-trans isomerase cyp5 [Tetrabaena socialis]|eukprot:PNH02456.1 Peptidyl-prolyl cis-trans isomerase cyp5 [Tetrabaena socialis]